MLRELKRTTELEKYLQTIYLIKELYPEYVCSKKLLYLEETKVQESVKTTALSLLRGMQSGRAT